MFISDSLEITDSVLAFDEIMEEIEIGKYLKPEQTSNTGRPGYNRVNYGMTWRPLRSETVLRISGYWYQA